MSTLSTRTWRKYMTYLVPSHGDPQVILYRFSSIVRPVKQTTPLKVVNPIANVSPNCRQIASAIHHSARVFRTLPNFWPTFYNTQRCYCKNSLWPHFSPSSLFPPHLYSPFPFNRPSLHHSAFSLLFQNRVPARHHSLTPA